MPWRRRSRPRSVLRPPAGGGSLRARRGPGGRGGVLATLRSAFAPVGEARLADPAPGLAFDWPVAVLGAMTAVAVVLALGVLSALRGARTHGSPRRARVVRPSAVGAAAAAAGAPAVAILGIRQA